MKYNTKEETWKDANGYEGLYKVSSYGRVSSCRRNIIMKHKIDKGYHRVNLYKNKKCKTIFVHRLVANAFVSNCRFNKEINHIDENKDNNYSNNLEWVTSEENANHGNRNEKISKSVVQLDKDTGEVINTYTSIKEASDKTGLFTSEISRCCNVKAKTTGGYGWVFM